MPRQRPESQIMAETLHEVICRGNMDEVGFLLEAGVEVNCPCPITGMYPLSTALLYNMPHIAIALVNCGANIDIEDYFSMDECCRHPIHYACQGGCQEMVEFLLNLDVDLETQDYGGATPLHHAAASGHTDLVKFLVDRGAVVDHKSKSGRTAMWKAAQGGHVQVVEFLIQSGCDTNNQNVLGLTVLFDLSRKPNRISVMKLLINAGCDLSLCDIEGNTALHTAASTAKNEAIELLLQSGIPVNALNANRNTALHNATQHNHVTTAIILLNHGACPSIKTIAGHSALYLAMLHKHSDCTRLMHYIGSKLTPHEIFTYETFEASRRKGKDVFYKWALSLFFTPLPLIVLCRIVVRKTIHNLLANTSRLPIPNALQKFLLFHDMRDEHPSNAHWSEESQDSE